MHVQRGAPAGTLEGLQAEVTPATPGMLLSLSVSPSPLAMHRPPSIATSAMSTTSSLGRRPFGNPAKSLPAGEVFRLPTMASRFWLANGNGAMAVFRRSISEGVTVAGLLTPVMPVRNTVARSVRGTVGRREARRVARQHQPEQGGQRGVGHVVEELPVVRSASTR